MEQNTFKKLASFSICIDSLRDEELERVMNNERAVQTIQPFLSCMDTKTYPLREKRVQCMIDQGLANMCPKYFSVAKECRQRAKTDLEAAENCVPSFRSLLRCTEDRMQELLAISQNLQ
eukprot:TRINITY_DN8024_c0_g1_i3.p1 TRINITY_DN8024_c0_g1~~TRINITY_DN8024_c0_g1_i3.p1  ORF type:complete len:119 (+),score=22.04 TRINITY_DN8024_c0_g1_i3:132-488(+)